MRLKIDSWTPWGKAQAHPGASRGALLIGAGLVVAAAVLWAAPGARAATCASSTPASATYPAPSGAGSAPDVTGVTLALDAACNLEISFGVANRPSGLQAGDDVQLQLDTDGNPATGQPSSIDPDYLGGADVRLDVGGTGASIAPFAGPSFGEFTPPTPVAKVGEFGARVPLSLLPSASGATLRAWGNSCSPAATPCSGDYFPALNSSFDGRVETYALPLVFSAMAPPSPPPPSPPPSGSPPPAKPANSPSNAFRLGKPKLHKRQGTATLTVRVPGAGRLVLFGKAVKRQAKRAGAAGPVKLMVRAKGKAARGLSRRGRVKVALKVRFTPRGGEPRTEAKKLRLAKARP